MKLSRIVLFFLFLCSITTAFSQSYPVFRVIDELAEDIDQLTAEFENQANVYFIRGYSPDALDQHSEVPDDLKIEELHIYTATKPGAIVFNSFAINIHSLEEITPALKEWSRIVSHRVVIHSEVVFSEDEGMRLKNRLEEITGLIFSSQN